MKLHQQVAREFRGYRYLEAARRLFDDKPMQCGLYVTDRCNLSCRYCSEYDNRSPHPRTEDLKLWVRKIRELGTTRIALAGGEPLLHPDIVPLVKYCRDLGLSTSLTTNGFPLTKERVRGLEDAGLQVMQISVDRMNPSEVTRKSFRLVADRLSLMRESPIRVHLTGVACGDTVGDSRDLLRAGLGEGLPTEVRLVHADPRQIHLVDPGEKAELRELVEWMIREKKRGVKIHTNDAVLRYQLGRLTGREEDWTCAAGFKIFFVSSTGRFWPCSMQRTETHILDVTPGDLKGHYRKKSCQEGCGVYCAVSTSMIYRNPVRVIGREILARSRHLPARLGRKLLGRDASN